MCSRFATFSTAAAISPDDVWRARSGEAMFSYAVRRG